eukprot:scaffold1290_cov248-Ochromonas_danica.AAC.43
MEAEILHPLIDATNSRIAEGCRLLLASSPSSLSLEGKDPMDRILRKRCSAFERGRYLSPVAETVLDGRHCEAGLIQDLILKSRAHYLLCRTALITNLLLLLRVANTISLCLMASAHSLRKSKAQSRPSSSQHR